MRTVFRRYRACSRVHFCGHCIGRKGDWKEARRATYRIQDAEACSRALSCVAAALARAGERDEASRTADEAQRVAHGISDEEARSRTLGSVAEGMAAAGRWKRAREVAEGVQDTAAQLRAYAKILSQYARLIHGAVLPQNFTQTDDED